MYCITNLFDDSSRISTLKRLKNVLRSTMTQQRISSLGVLAVEAQLAKTIDMDGAIDDFAVRKARRKTLGLF